MLLKNDIILKDNPDIRRIAKEVETPVSQEVLDTLKEMVKYLENSQDAELCEKYGLSPGVGLAAPQIDVNLRMFALMVDEDENNIFKCGIINPKILAKSIQMTYLEGGEGCLSIPDTRGIVLRHNRIKFKALFYDYENNKLEEKTMTLSGYKAIVFQHEYDHLDGILFTDKITQDVRGAKPCN